MSSGPGHADALRECREILEQNSKTFALASRFLAPDVRDRAAAVYAYCRRVDDAIDGASVADQPEALAQLTRELELVYRTTAPLDHPALRAFRVVALQAGLPVRYPRELILGMGMDVQGARYETLHDLLLYCHRVAGVVGLMMCHVFGITRDEALVPAAHLGMAMQLTNICRDVQEDWRLGRLYLPRQLLLSHGARDLPEVPCGPLPSDGRTLAAIAGTTRELLHEADRYYASAQRGIRFLPFTAGLAVRAAGRFYQAIGGRISARAHDPRCGRAVVPSGQKWGLALEAAGGQLADLPGVVRERWLYGKYPRPPGMELSFPEDVLPPAQTATSGERELRVRPRPARTRQIERDRRGNGTRA